MNYNQGAVIILQLRKGYEYEENKGKKFLSIFLILLLLISNANFVNNNKVLAAEDSNQNKVSTVEKEEVLSLRTETSKTYLNSDGTYTSEISQSPIHFKNDKEQWVSINNELIHNEKGNTYQNKANDFIVKFNGKQESNEPIIKIEDGDYIANMKLEPLEHTAEQPAPVEGIVKEDSISYSDIYKDVDLKYTIGSDRIKEDIIYKSKPENGFPTRFTYKMDLEMLKVKEQNGIIYLYDPSTNENIYHFESPYMYDSFKPEGYKSVEGIKSIPEEAISYDVNLTYEVVDNNLFLHLEPNQEWLNDSKRVYPLTIDPTIVKIQSSAYVEDTNLRSGFPTQTGGNDLELGGGASNGNIIRSILKFDLSSIPANINIVSSSLNLWFSSTNNDSPISISLFKLSRDWYENEASWNYAKINPSTSWTNRGGDYVVSNKLSTVSALTSPVSLDSDLKKWNIPTHIVYNWRNNLDPNFGFIIKSDSESTNFYKKFISSEHSVDNKYKPLLEITYTPPTVSIPTGSAYSDGNDHGFVNLTWAPVPGATGYKVWVFNGSEYEAFDVGNVTEWTSSEQYIWPTSEESASGRYKLHSDKLGQELPLNPSLVYSNAGTTYANREEYWFRISAYSNEWETEKSEASVVTIPAEIDHQELSDTEKLELSQLEESNVTSEELDLIKTADFDSYNSSVEDPRQIEEDQTVTAAGGTTARIVMELTRILWKAYKIYNKASEAYVEGAIEDYYGYSISSNTNLKKITLENSSKKIVLEHGTQNWGMEHILSKHHPKYWTGLGRGTKNTFFPDYFGFSDIENVIITVANYGDNEKLLVKNGFTKKQVVDGYYLKKPYRLVVKNGSVTTLYPLEWNYGITR